MNNYEYCTQWVLAQKKSGNSRVLDYGCGAGEITKALRKRNINAFGCDVFYGGGDYSKRIESRLIDDGVIKKMEGTAIPFDSEYFDCIINNQVMEHVENLDSVLEEIQRVLKPGGMVLSLFPHKNVWREGHCGIPFLHWFPKNSRPRIFYAAALRGLGFGYHKGNKSIMRWSRDFCEWLDKWTWYRSREEIDSTFNHYFFDIRHIEDDWLQYRCGGRKYIVNWLPASIQKWIVEKLAGMVFVAHKQGSR